MRGFIFLRYSNMAKYKQNKKAPQPQAKSAAQVVDKQPVRSALTPVNVLADKWLVIMLVAFAFLINAATIRYDYTLDDPYFTTDNPYVKEGLSGIPTFFTHAAYYGVFKNHDASYRPLMLTSFAVEKQLFGFNPQISHFINLVLFCIAIAFLFRLFRKIFNDYSPYIPFFIVLLYELHPIHTEVVASVKSRDELLALLFTSLSMLQSFKYIDSKKTLHLIVSAVFFFLALISKESSITFAAIMPLSIYFFRNEKPGKIITAVAPYLVMAGVYMLMRMAFIESDGEKVRILVNNNALMAATNYSDKLATILFIQFKYISLLIFPHPLSWDYSYSEIPIISFSNPKALLSIIVIGGLLAYALLRLKSKDVFSYCILFYCAGAVITSNLLVDIGSTMGERFIFTASLGYCIALVFLVVKLLKADKLNISYANSQKVFFVMIAISMLYAVKTVARNEVWKNNLVLYKSGIETAPGSWRSHYLLGVQYTKLLNAEKDPAAKKEIFNNAIEQFNSSYSILPSSDVSLLKGYAFEFGGYNDSAIAAYKLTLLLDSTNRQAASNLGGMYLRTNQLDAAIQLLSKVVARDTTFVDALYNLGAAYGNSGRFKEAEKYYVMAIRKTPNPQPNVLMSMSNIYKFMGDSANAQYYRQQLYKSLNAAK